ncbi:MAG TPA: glutamyl-tRNA reductase [Tepidisphaeraceae bacterium]|nr:glutamyl-tRNA reductase [Tepidisphaeraceae bacterium]
MRRLALLGLNHTTAPLDVREKLALSAEQVAAAIGQFRGQCAESEIVLLSTCNRVELYTTRPPQGELAAESAWADWLGRFLAAFRQTPLEVFQPFLYHKTAAAAAEHLFNVASSLDSMVLGETQILGQVRQAYETARQLGAAGPVLHPLFQRAAAVGKQVHTETPLAEGRLSVASVAVDYARRIFDTFADKSVLCVGAGKMSALVLRHLSELQPGRLIVCNRDVEKARALAATFHGVAHDLESLPDHLAAADIVVSGTGSPKPLMTRAMFETVMKRRRYKPVFVIDIALPRDVEPSVGEMDNVYLYNLDDLQHAVAATRGQRSLASEAAGKIVAEHLRQFTLAERAREMGPTIDNLYRRYHAVAQEELSRTLSKCVNVGPEEKAMLEECVRRLVNKVLHDPVRTLRQSDALHGDAERYVHALEKLFQLEEGKEQ